MIAFPTTSPLRRFLDELRDTDWFATNAGQDQVVYMPLLPLVIASDYPDLVETAVVEGDDLVVHYVDGDERRIRFPSYPDAGHAVTAYAPNEIHEDLRDWLQGIADE